MDLYLLYCILGAVVYGFVGVFTGTAFSLSFHTYANAKSLLAAIFWPLAWIFVLALAFWHWVTEK